jgi:hypothetical protein
LNDQHKMERHSPGPKCVFAVNSTFTSVVFLPTSLNSAMSRPTAAMDSSQVNAVEIIVSVWKSSVRLLFSAVRSERKNDTTRKTKTSSTQYEFGSSRGQAWTPPGTCTTNPLVHFLSIVVIGLSDPCKKTLYPFPFVTAGKQN